MNAAPTRKASSQSGRSPFVFLYTTLPAEAEARRIATALVERRLAACVNVFPLLVSVYEWKGKVEASAEVACLIKIRRASAQKVMSALRELHPYDVPAMVLLPVAGGSRDYFAWAMAQTAPLRSRKGRAGK